ncbi:sugar nucleotide-binding protein [Ornithinicoccus halotolerans]|uniref:sugar nucleotide-binding protein n=1 Tax=Ornithinicoccus halotolerans TaxID=1748220 RepID=UPI001296D06F|nr:sugar nucleotide-binding protein [Ornithinicoccus halotolerans]
MSQELQVSPTAIPGLLVVRMPVHGDVRGWFRENWQRAKMTTLGLPDFGPVQHSVAYNRERGVTRGIHAEPWDKFVSVVAGRAFGAWVDLRDGETFGQVHTQELDEHTAVFVPRGVGNSYQTLAPDTVYSYLVNAHWSPDAQYTHLNLADPTAAVPWPVPLSEAVISDKDRGHPQLADLDPVTARRVLLLGGSGQLGKALRTVYPRARVLSRHDLDLADPSAVRDLDLTDVDTVLNAAAFTAVDDAETADGRRTAFAVNATSVAALAAAAQRHGARLVHYSTDYVFDGTGGSGPEAAYLESDLPCPVSVYGASKAAGDAAVSTLPRHLLLRTSWVVGEGHNFVATMRRLAERGVSPAVVNDQQGRLTFADTLAQATAHLLADPSTRGTVNVTNSGEPGTWYDVARAVFQATGRDPADVTPVTTQEYAAGAGRPLAPRPATSVLDLGRLRGTGFAATDQWDALTDHLSGDSR